VLGAPATAGETYVVADPEPLTLAEIVRALRAGERRRPGLIPIPAILLAAPLKAIGRSDLWERLGGDSVVVPAKLIAAGWRPAIETRAGLAAMVQAASPLKSGTASRSTP
jgi:UDP-glucose 4-epimerase